MVEVSAETKKRLDGLIATLDALEAEGKTKGYKNLYSYLIKIGEYNNITTELLNIFKEIDPNVKSIEDVQRTIGLEDKAVDGKFGSKSLKFLKDYNNNLKVGQPTTQPTADFSQKAKGLTLEDATQLANQFEDKLKEALNKLFDEYGIGKKDREEVIKIIEAELRDVVTQINLLNSSGNLTQENVEKILNDSNENIERKASEYLGGKLTKREKEFWNRLALISAGIVGVSFFAALAIMMPGAIITAPTITAFANLSQTILGPLGLAGMGSAIGAAVTATATFITTMFSGIKSWLTGSKAQIYEDQVRGTMDRLANDLKEEKKSPTQTQSV